MSTARPPVRYAGTPGFVPAADRTGAPGTATQYAATSADPYRPAVVPPAPAGAPVPAPPGTTPALSAGTPGTVPPSPRTGTVARPRVWTRDSDGPAADVDAIYDGVSYYRRTAAARWVPDGSSGPGFAWSEIPAALRVDATGGHLAGPDGALIMARQRVGYASPTAGPPGASRRADGDQAAPGGTKIGDPT